MTENSRHISAKNRDTRNISKSSSFANIAELPRSMDALAIHLGKSKSKLSSSQHSISLQKISDIERGNLSNSLVILGSSGMISRPSSGYIRPSSRSSNDSNQNYKRPFTARRAGDTRSSQNSVRASSRSQDLLYNPETKYSLDFKKKTYKIPPVEFPPWNSSTRAEKPADISIQKKEPIIPPEHLVPQDEYPALAAEVTTPTTPNYESPKKSNPFSRSFTPTIYQLEICSKFLPSADEEPVEPLSNFTTTEAFALSKRLVPHIFQKCVNKVCAEYSLLSASVFKNSKILDADIQCFLDFTPFTDIPLGKYVTFAPLNVKNSNISPAVQLWTKKQEWISTLSNEKLFGVLVLDGKAAEYQQFVVFAASNVILDEQGLMWITKKIFQLYEENDRISPVKQIGAYSAEEIETFEDFSFNAVFSQMDIPFWRNQCIDVQQDQIGAKEKDQLQQQLKGLQKEKSTLQNALITGKKQRQEFEKELSRLREQRMAIERGINGEESVEKFTDPVTGEIAFVSRSTKEALIETVLGDEAIGDNVIPLLKKHDVSDEVQRKIRAAELDLEKFASLTEASVDHLSLTSREKRQILALAEYVMNRIKECIQEQGKVKFTLERQIAKITRGLQSSNDNLSVTKKKFDSNEDMSFRLENILHPPLEERKILPLSLKSLYDEVTINKEFCDINPWGIMQYTISEEILDNLQQFRSDWTLNIRNKRKNAKNSIGDQSSDNDSLLESDEDDDEKKRTEKRLKQSVDAVCLAAFGVLMKHISGNESFLIGCKTSFRTSELIVGPLTDVLPIRMDFSKKGMSFSTLFSTLYRMFKKVKRHGRNCPSHYVSKKLEIDLEFPVQFEFVSLHEYKELLSLGYTLEDLLKPQEISNPFQFGDLKMERLWSHSLQDKYDIRFVMIETDNVLECAVRYRQDKYDADKVAKWITKFQSTLEGIDCSRRKLSISSIISRYYHPLWQNSSSNISDSSGSSGSLNGSAMNLFSNVDLTAMDK